MISSEQDRPQMGVNEKVATSFVPSEIPSHLAVEHDWGDVSTLPTAVEQRFANVTLQTQHIDVYPSFPSDTTV